MTLHTENNIKVTVNGQARKTEVDSSTSVKVDTNEGETRSKQEVPEFDPTRGPPGERRPEYVH